MQHIKETQSFVISDRIINKENVLALAGALVEELSDNDNDKVKFTIVCTDSTKYEGSFVELFDNPVLQGKVVLNISLIYTSYSLDKSIDISIRTGDEAIFNTAVISGNDSTWVNGVVGKLNSIIKGFTPQINYAKKYKYIAIPLLSINLGFAALSLLARLDFASDEDKVQEVPKLIKTIEDWSFGPLLMTLIFSYMIGYYPTMSLFDRIKNLWPKIELQIGAKHTHHYAQKRRIYLAAITMVLVPFIINIISGLF